MKTDGEDMNTFVKIPRLTTLLGFHLYVQMEDKNDEGEQMQLDLLSDILINSLVAHGCSRESIDLNETVRT